MENGVDSEDYGLVYVLTNPAMPGLVKIGMTQRSGLEQRMRELYGTGVPVPFKCEYACKVKKSDTKQLEQALHTAFKPQRVNPQREFFAIEPEQANVDKILKAWSQIAHLHPEWKLELAGAGYLYDEMRQIAIQHHIPRVYFHGQVSDVVSLYERAEHLILASSHESFSCVVLESMAYGCHPIVFDYPSAKIVIPSQRIGTRIKNHSTEALAEAISKAILTKQSNKHHMEEVKTHLSQFTMDKLVNEWLRLIEQVSTSKSND